ncbi:MAG: ectoine/hydroxyectoine ABC transporter substrate-binding protein EhuB [Anaerolineales bacterium]
MNNKKFAVLFGIVAILVLAISACQPQVVEKEVIVTQEVEKEVVVTEVVEVAPEEMSTMDKIKEDGVVVVAIANEFPYGYLDDENMLRGESPDVAREALKVMFGEDVVFEPVVTEWGALIPGLNAGRFDMITAAMYITPERCAAAAFANPDYTIVDGLVVAEGNPFDLHSYADIAANPDAQAGTGNGYAEYDVLLNEGVTEEQITLFPDDASGIAGVQAGQIDVWTGTAPTLNGIMSDLGEGAAIEIVEDFEPPVANYGAAVFRQDDTEFVEAYNAALEELKDSGKLLEIHERYEGFGSFTLPGDTTAAEICNP